MGPGDGEVMSNAEGAVADQGSELLSMYDAALPEVYGYLLRRCRSAPVAEDLTSETFIAAVDAIERNKVPQLTVAWLIGVARHKLVDHWRRLERQDRMLASIDDVGADVVDDEWDVHLDALLAHDTLGQLGAHHQSALTLRYLDGLPVREVARHLGRTEGATEVLLVRARRAFRSAYENAGGER